MSADTRTIVREHEADLVVQQARAAADDVVALTLVDPTGADLPEWTPGAHVDLVIDENLTRQYSLCGDPSDTKAWRVAVLKNPDSRGGSVAVHERLQPGTTVRVRGPRNHFPLVGSPRYQFIAGGIGITPMLPMIAEAKATGAEWHLLYGGRKRASMAFVDELTGFDDNVSLAPHEETGRMDLRSVLGEARPDTLVYCCGPAGLLGAVEEMCQAWPPGSLHLERFSAKPQAVGGIEESFEVILARSGMTLQVPADASIFDVLQKAGVSVLGSCFEGVCGTCETGVLNGDVDHRDSILDDEERESNEFMMICVSRCKGKQLTLDL